MSSSDALGFGAVERCQVAIGISCSECKYHDACIGTIDEEVIVDRSD